MSPSVFHEDNTTVLITHPNWGAVWAGVFTFFAIWCVFGLLGMSIFASAAGANAAHATTGANVGMGIWAILLTIVAMYIAGRATGHLARIGNARDGFIHGMIMFGLTVVSALVITVLAGYSIGTAPTATPDANTPYLLGVFADLGWFGFFSLFFGWLAAMGGASAGAHTKLTHAVQQVTHA